MRPDANAQVSTLPNDTHMKIRPAEDRDAAGLAGVYLDSARHHTAIDPSVHQVPEAGEAVERIRAKLRDEAATMFVAEHAGVVIGLLQIELVPPPAPGTILRPIPSAHVGVAVREGQRDRGVGAALMQFAERWALEKGCTTMILDMSAANAGALRFYERLGYRTYGLMLKKSL
jgi:GNAT superfamily N-acetyltransferase